MQTIDLHTIISGSITGETFIRLILSSPFDKKGGLNKVTIRVIELKDGPKLSFLYTYRTKAVTKNYDIQEGSAEAEELFGNTFKICVIFTTEKDFSFKMTKKDKLLFKESKPLHTECDFSTEHNMKKKRMISIENNIWLEKLGVSKNGKLSENMSGKFRQINRFIETIDGLLDSSGLGDKKDLKVYDMGSGKGYLTFAVYDFLTSELGLNPVVTGIEFRDDLVSLCKNIAKKCGYNGLNFLQGTIQSYDLASCDILIALHACDTATDDAIFKGIRSGAEAIIVSPCCHKQIRKQLHIENELKEITRHGILEERLAEMATDTLRALVLEQHGYKTNIFEYISDEHTHKNIMITAVRKKKTAEPSVYLEKIGGLKKFLGINKFYLDELVRQNY